MQSKSWYTVRIETKVGDARYVYTEEGVYGTPETVPAYAMKRIDGPLGDPVFVNVSPCHMISGVKGKVVKQKEVNIG
jgi:hypothetical protein